MAEEAQAAEEGADGDAPAKKKTPGKVLVLFVGAPLLLIIIGAVVYFMFLSGGGEPKADEHADAGEHGAEHGGDDHGDGHGDDHGDGHGDDHGDGHGDGHGDDHGDGHGAGHVGPDGKVPPLKPADAIFVEMPDLLVNLNTNKSKPAYLKLKVALEVHKEIDTHHLDEVMPRVVDKFQVYLREMRVDDLSGSAGMFRLKEELLRRVNAATHPIHVYDVLFREMLIQ